jgi:hypothetical protein
MDKFAEYFKNNPDKIEDLSEYVHINMKIIMTKMTSEMRRELEIIPNHTNTEGYVSLMTSIYGRMFNEMIYGMSAFCQAYKLKATDIIPIATIDILIGLLKDSNPLKGEGRADVPDNLRKFEEMYVECIDELRAVKEALPSFIKEKK